MSTIPVKPEQKVVYQDVCALLEKHADKMTAIEILATAANLVGKLVALQDGRVTSAAVAMETVARNIEVGNREAIKEMMKAMGEPN